MSELNITAPAVGGSQLEPDNVKQNAKQASVVNDAVVDADEIKKEREDEQATALPLSASEVTETVKEMNSLLENMNRNLSFSVDEQLGLDVIVVKDSESDEVIRQIPSEELVVLRKKMDDVVGILFDSKV